VIITLHTSPKSGNVHVEEPIPKHLLKKTLTLQWYSNVVFFSSVRWNLLPIANKQISENLTSTVAKSGGLGVPTLW